MAAILIPPASLGPASRVLIISISMAREAPSSSRKQLSQGTPTQNLSTMGLLELTLRQELTPVPLPTSPTWLIHRLQLFLELLSNLMYKMDIKQFANNLVLLCHLIQPTQTFGCLHRKVRRFLKPTKIFPSHHQLDEKVTRLGSSAWVTQLARSKMKLSWSKGTKANLNGHQLEVGALDNDGDIKGRDFCSNYLYKMM